MWKDDYINSSINKIFNDNNFNVVKYSF